MIAVISYLKAYKCLKMTDIYTKKASKNWHAAKRTNQHSHKKIVDISDVSIAPIKSFNTLMRKIRFPEAEKNLVSHLIES